VALGGGRVARVRAGDRGVPVAVLARRPLADRRACTAARLGAIARGRPRQPADGGARLAPGRRAARGPRLGFGATGGEPVARDAGEERRAFACRRCGGQRGGQPARLPPALARSPAHQRATCRAGAGPPGRASAARPRLAVPAGGQRPHRGVGFGPPGPVAAVVAGARDADASPAARWRTVGGRPRPGMGGAQLPDHGRALRDEWRPDLRAGAGKRLERGARDRARGAHARDRPAPACRSSGPAGEPRSQHHRLGLARRDRCAGLVHVPRVLAHPAHGLVALRRHRDRVVGHGLDVRPRAPAHAGVRRQPGLWRKTTASTTSRRAKAGPGRGRAA
jgi:hypothetical protein